MVSKNRISKLEEQMPEPREPEPDLSDLSDHELNRLLELTAKEEWTPEQEEELKNICRKIDFPNTKKMEKLY